MKHLQNFGHVFLLFGLLIACAPPVQQRQTVQGPSFGVSGFGKVVEIFEVQDGSTFGNDRFSRPAEEGGLLAAAAAVADEERLSGVISAFVGAVSGAIVGETEDQIRKHRCLYFISLEDAGIKDSLRSSVFFSTGANSADLNQVDPGYILTPDGRLLMESNATPEEVEWYRAQKNNSSNGQIETPVVLPQSCDSSIEPGSEVLVTFFNWGGTIHPRPQSFSR